MVAQEHMALFKSIEYVSTLCDFVGAHCVQEIQRCGCVRGCYRASFRQVYTATVFDAQTNRNKTLEEVS